MRAQTWGRADGHRSSGCASLRPRGAAASPPGDTRAAPPCQPRGPRHQQRGRRNPPCRPPGGMRKVVPPGGGGARRRGAAGAQVSARRGFSPPCVAHCVCFRRGHIPRSAGGRRAGTSPCSNNGGSDANYVVIKNKQNHSSQYKTLPILFNASHLRR